MNAKEFEIAVGCKPVQDDLERANCDKRGEVAHKGCGVCEHGQPVFICPLCFVKVNQGHDIKYE